MEIIYKEKILKTVDRRFTRDANDIFILNNKYIDSAHTRIESMSTYIELLQNEIDKLNNELLNK